MELPVVFQYQRALDEFRRAGEASPLLKRMSELISLLDLTTTLSSTLSSQEILEAALLIVMGELQVTRGNLLHYLKYSPEGAAAAQEAERRKKLAKTLHKAAGEAHLRHVKLPVERGQSWLLKDLANVSIEDGRLVVVFSDALDLAGQLYKLAEAMGAEWEVFVGLCEGKNGQQKSNGP